MILFINTPPAGPDICYLLGFCQTSGGVASPTNLLFLATGLIMGAWVIRSSKRRKADPPQDHRSR